MTELDTSKFYEWFLQEIAVHKRPAGAKLKLVWNCVTENIAITEWCSVNADKTYGPRLTEFAKRVNLPSPDDFRKGMHIWAKVHRHWTQERHESVEYELRYDSLSRKAPKELTVDDAARKRLAFLARQATTWDEARAVVKAKAPDLLQAFEHLRQNGELALAG